MQHRVDPRSGNKISALGLGCMRFPGYAVGRPDPVAAEAVISRAVERGINYLDTAYLYPGNEELVGATLGRLGLGERVLVATKLPHASCVEAGDFDRFFDEELRRLCRDHVDYYLMHNVTSPAQWERLRSIGIEGWLDRQRSSGRIREVGFSFHGSEGDFPVLLDAYDWDFCQIQYNYVGERYQAGTAGLMAAHERGMAVFVMEPLLGGRLADKMPDRARRILDAAGAPLPGLAVAGGDGVTSPAANAAAWGLSWVWNHPEVTMLLSGMASPAQVDANCDVAELALPGALGREGLDVIARVVAEFERCNRVPCTGCNYCMPCPRGINIPGCFSAYNASYAYGWFAGVQQYFTASGVRTESPRLVSNCVACGKCARHCPQHIDIPARLADVRRRLQPAIVDPFLGLVARNARLRQP